MELILDVWIMVYLRFLMRENGAGIRRMDYGVNKVPDEREWSWD